MTAPLLMTGPGGDYVYRFVVMCDGLVRTRTSQSACHESNVLRRRRGWGFLGRRKNKQQAKATCHTITLSTPSLPPCPRPMPSPLLPTCGSS